MPLLRFHNFQMVILFSFLLFVSISSTLPSKEQKSVFSSQENGAQKITRIRTGESTDDEPAQQDKKLEPPNLGASPEGQPDEESSSQLRNVAKDVEEKLGLDPPRGELISSDRDNKNREIGNAQPRSNGISEESPPAIDSGGGLSPLLALGGGAQQALAGRVGGVQLPVLLAALLRQQRQRQLQQLSSARGNTPGIGTNLATLQALQQQRQQQDQQQLQQRRALQQQQQRQQQQQIQALLQQVALQQQLLAGRRAAGGDARLRGIGTAESSFRNNFEGSAAPSSSIFGPISGPTIPGPISVPPGLITSSASTRRGARISSGRPSSSGFLPSSTGASSFPGFGDPNAALLNLLRNAQSVSPSSMISPPIVAQQPFWTRVRSSPPSGTSDSLPSTLTFPDSAPPNSAPTVIRLVTDAAQQPQPQTQQSQRELQQILDQEQRILGVLERESRSNQLVEGQRRELQTLQEQQQRILELLRAVTLRQDTVESDGDSMPNIRRRNAQQSKDNTKKTAEIATSQQPKSGGDNEILLRQLLQSLLSNNIANLQGTAATNTLPPSQQFVPSGQIAQQNPLINFGDQADNILRPIPAVAGQSQQLQPQQLQQFLDLSAQSPQQPQQVQAVPGVGPQQPIFGQDIAGQIPPVQQQFVTVLDPRTGQQFIASVATNGDNTERGGTVGEQTEQQQQVGAVQRERRRGAGRKGAAGQQIAGGPAGISTIDGEAQLLSQLIQRAQSRNTEKIKGSGDEEEEETDEEEEDEDEDEE